LRNTLRVVGGSVGAGGIQSEGLKIIVNSE
jgi:hypothetical protein